MNEKMSKRRIEITELQKQQIEEKEKEKERKSCDEDYIEDKKNSLQECRDFTSVICILSPQDQTRKLINP